ncbi:MAG: hypothetical protein A2V70_04285 [Planctomycetes bacterium RBG_13_63_9]|nr:MAG: hypothetical protein A2V70_04285 [Planctomycetes bacterium RBG_13_63_9]
MTTVTEDKLLGREEVALLLGLKSQTLAAWALTGRHLPYIKVGRSVRYRVSDIDNFLRRQTVGADAR